MTGDNQTEQTSMIQAPASQRETPDVDAVKRGKTRNAIKDIPNAEYQGLGPNGLVVAIAADDETEVRRELEDNGIHIADECVDCENIWVGIPNNHTLYDITEVTI